jgi:small-conductance mechanosensitive channel
MIEEVFQIEFLGNSVHTYFKALLILLLGAAGVTIIRLLLPRLLHGGRRGGSEEGREAPGPSRGEKWVRRTVVPLLYLGVLYLALSSLSLGSRAEALLRGAVAVVVTVVVVRGVLLAAEGLLQRILSRAADEQEQRRLKPLRSILGIVAWTIGAVFLLDNLGFDISAVVAALGVSGIAVAIAAQGVLGDLFNYFVILFDRPFETGDFIIFEGKLGTVERIGIKTTRIRALSGEELIVANSGLTGTQVHNYARMENRRVVFTFGVRYETKPESLRRIPEIVRQIIEERENTRFDRSHFREYGEYSLIFENVYYVLSADYAEYMGIQQEINLRIYEAFEEMGVEFAYPTQTLYLPGRRRSGPFGPAKTGDADGGSEGA